MCHPVHRPPPRPEGFTVVFTALSLPVEISPVEAGNAGDFDSVWSDAMTLVGLSESVAVPCMTPWQIAQKIRRCTGAVEAPRTNERAHDLGELQLLEVLTVDDPLADLEAGCRAVFEGRRKSCVATRPRGTGPLGGHLRAPVEGLEDIGIAGSLDDAVVRVQAFIDRSAGTQPR